jgi:nitrite reductase (NADH) large subunit
MAFTFIIMDNMNLFIRNDKLGGPMKVIIIGNSAAGLSALEAFRKIDTVSQVRVISKELPKPYSRVQLPYYLKDRVDMENLFIRHDSDVEELNAEILIGQVTELDTTSKKIYLNTKQILAYDRLLICSGSLPFIPEILGIESSGIHNIWTMEDALALKDAFESQKRVLIMGGGFIAMQATWAAAQCSMETTLCVRSVIMRRDLDDHARDSLKERINTFGITLMEGTMPEKIIPNADGTLRVIFSDTHSIVVDKIVSAVGVRPNTKFLEGSDIEIDGGVLVNDFMQTTVQDVFAAGDVAAARTSCGNSHEVRALWPCAVEQGAIAGQNLTGDQVAYQGSLNMNVTELFGLVIASIGKFTQTEGFEAWTWYDQKDGSYLSIFLDGGVPVGGISLGHAGGVGILGMLRPYIRYHRYLGEQRPDDLEQELQMKLFPGLYADSNRFAMTFSSQPG